MKKKLLNNKGFTLLFSLVFLFLIIMSCETYFLVASGGLGVAARTADAKRAYYAADAGLAEGVIQVRSSFTPNLSPIMETPYAIGPKNGSYAVNITSDLGTWPVYTITSTGKYNRVIERLELKVRQSAPSMFAYLSNSENHPTLGKLWWITGMRTYGTVHTNGQLNIWGDPIFYGPVSQTASTVNYWPGVPTNPADFMGGLTLGVPARAVFNSAILNSVKTTASSTGGLLLTGDSAITFNSNGTINVTNSKKKWNNQNMAAPANKAIFVQSGSATVKGTVSGQLTVGADTNIYISNNLAYSTDSDPTNPNPASTDILALVANNNITVTVKTAPTNMMVAAVLVAINGSFQCDNWSVQGKGNMLQYGSLINNVCGPTGVFDPGTGELTGGYNQLQYFDPKMERMVPPCFPALLDGDGRVAYKRVSFREL